MTGSPAIILIRPQLAENIGTAARAMLNCGLTDMRLVRPRVDRLDERAVAASAGATLVLENARVFETTETAIADLTRVYATTGRNRYMEKRVLDPRAAAADMVAEQAQGRACGILFGPERTGLENDDVALADTVLTVPLNPDYCSLNLAQAVLLIGYEWWQAAAERTVADMTKGRRSKEASKELLVGLFEHLERELDACGFLRVPEKRPGMVRNIRNMFQRTRLTEQEVRTMHGIITELVTARKNKAERGGN